MTLFRVFFINYVFLFMYFFLIRIFVWRNFQNIRENEEDVFIWTLKAQFLFQSVFLLFLKFEKQFRAN